jgi:hypothetical protein
MILKHLLKQKGLVSDATGPFHPIPFAKRNISQFGPAHLQKKHALSYSIV